MWTKDNGPRITWTRKETGKRPASHDSDRQNENQDQQPLHHALVLTCTPGEVQNQRLIARHDLRRP